MQDKEIRRGKSLKGRHGQDNGRYNTHNSPQEPTGILAVLEPLFTRIQQSLEYHSNRLRNIEHSVAGVLSTKLDALINVTVNLNTTFQKFVDLTERTSDKPAFKHETHQEKKAVESTALLPQIPPPPAKLTSHQSTAVLPPKLEPTPPLAVPIEKRNLSRMNTIVPGRLREASLPHRPIHHEPQRPSTANNVKLVSVGYANTIESGAILADELKRLKLERRNVLAPNIPDPPLTLIYCIKNLVGWELTGLTERMYAEYSQGNMLQHELRAKFSWSLAKFLMGIARNLRTNYEKLGIDLDSSARGEIFSNIDLSMRNILEFLIRKYPPSRHKIVDTELARDIREVKRHGDIKYDILRNAGVSFTDDTGKSDFSYDIKRWLNVLIEEVKRTYPSFHGEMKKLFAGKEMSVMEEDEEEIEYEIGTKISQTVEPFSEAELREPGIRLKSTQLQRVLCKWAEDLRHTMAQADKLIVDNKNGFKSAKGSYAIYLTTARKEELARRLLDILKTKVVPLTAQRRQRLLLAMSDVLTLVQKGVLGYEQQDMEEIVALKATQFFDECSQGLLVTMLNTLIEHFNQVRKLYSEDTLESGLDLVTFNVLDILRCRCVGSKRDIRRIYSELVANPAYQVIRVKNKLNESTRDILLNFKRRDSFLVCEMQLSLGHQQDEINDHFCHYLYELQRSIFPVLFEISTQVVSFDPRMEYFRDHALQFPRMHRLEQIDRYIGVRDHKLCCWNRHDCVPFHHEANNVPFCCVLCSTFVSAGTFMLGFVRCPNCTISVCPKCAIRHSPEIAGMYRSKHINWKELRLFLKEEPEVYNGFCSEKQLLPKIVDGLSSHSYLIMCMFQREGLKHCVVKLLEGQVVRTFVTLDGALIRFDDARESWSFLWAPAETQRISLEEVREYAKVMLDGTPWHELEQLLKRKQLKEVVGVKSEATRQILVVDIPEETEEARKCVRQQLLSLSLRKDLNATDPTIELTSKELADLTVLQEVENPASVRSINLWDNRLSHLPDLSKFASLTELVLCENNLTSLESLPSLQGLKLLNLQRNCLSGELPPLPLPQLEVLDISFNNITGLAGLTNFTYGQLKVLFLNDNRVEALPVLHCPQLEVLEFSNNKVSSLEALAESSLPKLYKMRASKNEFTELPVLNLPGLKYLSLKENKVRSVLKFGESKLLALESLDLSKNLIEGPLPPFKHMRLRKMTIASNKITDLVMLEKWLVPLLLELDFSSNEISGEIPRITLPQLRSLNIQNNHATRCSEMFMGRLDNLEKLWLSSNELQELPWMSLMQLKELHLNNNLLKSLEHLAQSQLPRLELLDLSKNKLVGTLPKLYMPALAELNLDDNNFEDVEALKCRQLLPLLRKVGIRNNEGLIGEDGTILLELGAPTNIVKRRQLCLITHNFTNRD